LAKNTYLINNNNNNNNNNNRFVYPVRPLGRNCRCTGASDNRQTKNNSETTATTKNYLPIYWYQLPDTHPSVPWYCWLCNRNGIRPL